MLLNKKDLLMKIQEPVINAPFFYQAGGLEMKKKYP